MEGSTSKVEAMKPVLVKAGIPAAITVIGFVIAKIAGRKYLVSKVPSLSEIEEKSEETDSKEMYIDDKESFHSLDSASLPCVESDHAFTDACYENSIETLFMQEEISGLRSQIQDLNMRFLRYQNLKEQKMVLMELQNKLLLEKTSVEYFRREISLMAAEIQRFEHIVIENLKIMGLLEFLRSENALLHKKAKKLDHVLKKQNLRIVAKETEISRARKEQEMKDICIKTMDNEIRELKIASERLRGEKNDLLSKLADKSAVSKIEGEEMTLKNYNQLANEVEQIHKDRAAETKELTYTEQDEAMEENNHHVDEIAEYRSDHELVSSSRLGQGESCLSFTRGSHAQSKRRKLIAKLKRWVEGSEKMNNLDKKEQQENILARKSCSCSCA